MSCSNWQVVVLVAQSCLFLTPWTVPHQTPLSIEFSSQEYWSGLPFPSPEDLPNPEIKPESPGLQTDSLPFELQGRPNWQEKTLNKKSYNMYIT